MTPAVHSTGGVRIDADRRHYNDPQTDGASPQPSTWHDCRQQLLPPRVERRCGAYPRRAVGRGQPATERAADAAETGADTTLVARGRARQLPGPRRGHEAGPAETPPAWSEGFRPGGAGLAPALVAPMLLGPAHRCHAAGHLAMAAGHASASSAWAPASTAPAGGAARQHRRHRTCWWRWALDRLPGSAYHLLRRRAWHGHAPVRGRGGGHRAGAAGQETWGAEAKRSDRRCHPRPAEHHRTYDRCRDSVDAKLPSLEVQRNATSVVVRPGEHITVDGIDKARPPDQQIDDHQRESLPVQTSDDRVWVGPVNAENRPATYQPSGRNRASAHH